MSTLEEFVEEVTHRARVIVAADAVEPLNALLKTLKTAPLSPDALAVQTLLEAAHSFGAGLRSRDTWWPV